VPQAATGVVPFAVPLVHEAVQSLAQGEPVAQPQFVISSPSNAMYAEGLFVSQAASQAALPPAPDELVLEEVEVELELEVEPELELEVEPELEVELELDVPPVPVPPVLLELHAMARAAGARSARSLIEERTMEKSFRHAEGSGSARARWP